MTTYDTQFYKNQKEGSKQSAQKIVPFIVNLLHPQSVVDVGCGVGTWLSVFKNHKVTNILGIDGSYVDRKQLLINESEFLPKNLTEPIEVGKRFDLAISLEVAEHLPNDKAEQFVTSLTKLASVVLFSAAIPGQGGVHHVNEQWPDYWFKLFAKRNYVPIDCVRMHFWDDEKVQYWYTQNILLYVDKTYKASNHNLFDKINSSSLGKGGEPFSLVHPRMYSVVHPQLIPVDKVDPKNTIILLIKTIKKVLRIY